MILAQVRACLADRWLLSPVINKQTQNKTNNKKLFVDLSVVRLCLLASLLSKSFRLLDGEQELLSELFQASVGRQIQTIEAEEKETELHLSVDLQMEHQGDIYLFFKRSQAAHSSNRGSEILIFIFPPVGTVLILPALLSGSNSF